MWLLEVSRRLALGVTKPDVLDPMDNPLSVCRINSAIFDDINGSSIITTRFVWLTISSIAGLKKICSHVMHQCKMLLTLLRADLIEIVQKRPNVSNVKKLLRDTEILSLICHFLYAQDFAPC